MGNTQQTPILNNSICSNNSAAHAARSRSISASNVSAMKLNTNREHNKLMDSNSSSSFRKLFKAESNLINS